MTVRCKDLLHWDELWAHREEPSTAADRSIARSKRGRGREERGERQAKQAFAAAGSNSMAWAKIWDWSLDSGLCHWAFIRTDGELWREEEQEIVRAFFFFFSWYQAAFSAISVLFLSCMTSNIFLLFLTLLLYTHRYSPASSISLIYSVTVDKLLNWHHIESSFLTWRSLFSSSMMPSSPLVMTVLFFLFFACLSFLVLSQSTNRRI